MARLSCISASQEPVVKEVIDSVYSARSDIWISSPVLRNTDLLSALRYKQEAGFDVRILTAEPLPREWTGIFDAQIRPTIRQTLVIMDGDFAQRLPGYARGKPLSRPYPYCKASLFTVPMVILTRISLHKHRINLLMAA